MSTWIREDHIGGGLPIGSPEAAEAIARVGRKQNENWDEGIAKLRAERNGVPDEAPKYRKCLACPRRFVVTNGKTRLCPECRYSRERESSRMRDRRRSEKEADFSLSELYQNSRT